ncbi:MAG: DUF3179 domain-containing (seleno)protein [Spirosomataceae bacterium]|jgi:hypothetical protein
MKKIFYIAAILLMLFEVSNVYFIMPMPGSQRMRSIEVAYFLYTYRWIFRVVFGFGLLLGFQNVFQAQKWLVVAILAVVAGVIYMFNFQMAADHMFYQPTQVLMKDTKSNKIKNDKLIVGIVVGNEARAYPIQLIGYHHQVMDTIAGKPVMVTYCTVCRTARVFEPKVNGKYETFRLVGMDHFNAMFEDKTTKSWWRQANGEALAGKLKGVMLPEIYSRQMSLAKWLALYPDSKILQADSNFKASYEKLKKYDSGKGSSDLTKTDSLSWKDKSWVVGVKSGKAAKAFDWNRLKRERIINDKVGHQPIVLVLASDNKSFVAFERESFSQKFTLKNDSLYLGKTSYNFNGISNNSSPGLKKAKAYQEFWHSWETFYPETEKY